MQAFRSCGGLKYSQCDISDSREIKLGSRNKVWQTGEKEERCKGRGAGGLVR